MVKDVSVRFAWHDDKWDGGICKDPEKNYYCTGNYSLLSPRIQRRINQDIENRYKNQKISKVMSEQQYLPPCYWCINAFGNEQYSIEDRHPFEDTKRWGERFKREVQPLRDTLKKFSVFTWCFKLGFAEEEVERYPPPPELKERTEKYLKEIKEGESIVFFYANYSNPLTGDDYKYLLLGAGLVKDTAGPQEYKIPSKLLDEVRSNRGMKNFPTQAWQFQITLEPNTAFVLPYHEYLKWIDEESEMEAKKKRWKKLEEVVIPIEEETIIPHFKYVSMHLQRDKSIYLLYLFKKSLKKMKEHRIVEYLLLDEIEKN